MYYSVNAMKCNKRGNPLIKYITLFPFIWVSFCTELENISNGKNSSLIAEYRPLLEYLKEAELYESELEDYLLNCRSNKIITFPDNGPVREGSNGLTLYDILLKSCSICLTIYKDKLKRKYAESKGLRRLNYYFEQKIFDVIDSINEKKLQSKGYVRTIIGSIVRKWSIRKIAKVCSIPLIGIILLIALGISAITTPAMLNVFAGISGIVFTLLTFAILFVPMYTMTKVVKYYGLEAGLDELNFWEFCVFWHHIFFPKGCKK
ncbi:hypothetical protein AK88_00938 [Plasmodium fragile]|uniref:Variable surface protein n=1 Tax=Plasmodium fragile TaxID=5857 RepID=A0A0D9QQV6_PLAFR|nr:uncharacterized protein AK88_00938 [Plasmodium fragile]KJP89495.1 hypothetical protein AK88_00938 [Plasmodium fragile]